MENKLVYIHIHTSSNNSIITVTDLAGNTILWASPATLGVKGANRSNIGSAELTGFSVGQRLIELKLYNSIIKFKGFGAGRMGALQGIRRSGLNILSLQDVTATPHNGCRPSKKRRL